MKCTPIDHFLDLFICLLYSCSGTSQECPAVVVSQHCSGPFSIVSLFHSCDIFTKAFTMFITNYIIGPTTVVRKEIQMGMKKVDLRIHKTLSLLFALLSHGNAGIGKMAKSGASWTVH